MGFNCDGEDLELDMDNVSTEGKALDDPALELSS